jgi:hypothetical protein
MRQLTRKGNEVAKYKVTTPVGTETIDGTKIDLDGPHMIILDAADNVVAAFAPGWWCNITQDQPDTYGAATKAVS